MAKVRKRNIEELKKKQETSKNFRRVARSVVINRVWMSEMDDDKLTLNVEKNITTLVRTQNKIGILTKAEKSLLRTPHSCRTVQERKDLVKLISGQLCFSRIPPKLRARLVPVINFMILGPRRKIINYGDPSSMIFYIITGEVKMSTRVVDPLTNNYIEEPEYIAGPGDCIGDMEILEGCNRINTYTTTADTELLVLHEDDFNQILRPFLLQRWLNLKRMVDSLQYFNYMTKEQLLRCRKLGKLALFEPLETIYHQDRGKASFVHFVISGECMILQCLKIMVKTRDGKKTYELVQFTKDDDVFQNISEVGLLKQFDEENPNKKSEIDEIFSVEDAKNVMKKADLKTIEIQCGIRDPSYEKNANDIEENSMNDNMEEVLKEENLKPSSSKTTFPTTTQRLTTRGKLSGATTNIENHFIDVGTYSHGGIFGLGERMEQRVIMARTTVHCFKVPRFWLLSELQNPGNIWQRRRSHLDSNIPSRETLFKDFLTTRKWQKFKHDLVKSSVGEFGGNPTKTQDVPIIGRIVETNDD